MPLSGCSVEPADQEVYAAPYICEPASHGDITVWQDADRRGGVQSIGSCPGDDLRRNPCIVPITCELHELKIVRSTSNAHKSSYGYSAIGCERYRVHTVIVCEAIDNSCPEHTFSRTTSVNFHDDEVGGGITIANRARNKHEALSIDRDRGGASAHADPRSTVDDLLPCFSAVSGKFRDKKLRQAGGHLSTTRNKDTAGMRIYPDGRRVIHITRRTTIDGHLPGSGDAARDQDHAQAVLQSASN